MNSLEIYLGDGVYARYDKESYSVILYTSNGIETTNTIVLEPEVLDNLNTWLKSLFANNQLHGVKQ